MAAPRRTPDETVLRRWYLDEHLTYREMKERWAKMPGGFDVSTAAFAAACGACDWFVPRNHSHVGTEYWPWLDVRAEHLDMHDAAMLRLYGRRKAGDKLSKKLDHRLNAWLRTLREENAVIAYKPDTQQGWWHVKREVGDVDIVRWPASYKRAQKRHLSAVKDAG